MRATDTQNDLWYKETSALEPEAMVAELRAQGMTGIYLDLDGYPEDEQQSALAALTEAAGLAARRMSSTAEAGCSATSRWGRSNA